MTGFARTYLDGLLAAAQTLDADRLEEAITAIRRARDLDRTIYSCGNGGSASIASQMVVDLVKGASLGKARRVRMMSLCDSIATVTAYSNDVNYECVFEEQLRNWVQEDDVLIAISGSGNSQNVLRAVELANSEGAVTIACTTAEGGQLRSMARIPLLVGSQHMGHLEDCFFVMTHVMCYALMED